MAPLTKGRLTPERPGQTTAVKLAAGAAVFAGGIVFRTADGYGIAGQAVANAVGVGIARADADNTDGADGAVTVEVMPGTFRLENAATDLLDMTRIGSRCFAHDDQTVGRTNGGGARSPVGFVADVDENGVWVRFDEHLLAAAAI